MTTKERLRRSLLSSPSTTSQLFPMNRRVHSGRGGGVVLLLLGLGLGRGGGDSGIGSIGGGIIGTKLPPALLVLAEAAPSSSSRIIGYSTEAVNFTIDDIANNQPPVWSTWLRYSVSDISNQHNAEWKKADASLLDDTEYKAVESVGFCLPSYGPHPRVPLYLDPNGFISTVPYPMCASYCAQTPTLSRSFNYEFTDSARYNFSSIIPLDASSTDGQSQADAEFLQTVQSSFYAQQTEEGLWEEGGSWPIYGLYVSDLNPYSTLSTQGQSFAEAEADQTHGIFYSNDVDPIYLRDTAVKAAVVDFRNVAPFMNDPHMDNGVIEAQAEFWSNGTVIFKYRRILSRTTLGKLKLKRPGSVGIMGSLSQRAVADPNWFLSETDSPIKRAIRFEPIYDPCAVHTTCGTCLGSNNVDEGVMSEPFDIGHGQPLEGNDHKCVWCRSKPLSGDSGSGGMSSRCVHKAAADDYCSPNDRAVNQSSSSGHMGDDCALAAFSSIMEAEVISPDSFTVDEFHPSADKIKEDESAALNNTNSTNASAANTIATSSSSNSTGSSSESESLNRAQRFYDVNVFSSILEAVHGNERSTNTKLSSSSSSFDVRMANAQTIFPRLVYLNVSDPLSPSHKGDKTGESGEEGGAGWGTHGMYSDDVISLGSAAGVFPRVLDLPFNFSIFNFPDPVTNAAGEGDVRTQEFYESRMSDRFYLHRSGLITMTEATQCSGTPSTQLLRACRNGKEPFSLFPYLAQVELIYKNSSIWSTNLSTRPVGSPFCTVDMATPASSFSECPPAVVLQYNNMVSPPSQSVSDVHQMPGFNLHFQVIIAENSVVVYRYMDVTIYKEGQPAALDGYCGVPPSSTTSLGAEAATVTLPTWPRAVIGISRDGISDASSVTVPSRQLRLGGVVLFTPVIGCADCDGRGYCNPSTGQCECIESFSGPGCRECAPGRWGMFCEPCAPCLNGGRCNGTYFGSGQCICDAPWSGPDCGTRCESGKSAQELSCPNCNFFGGECYCGECRCKEGSGWSGEHCDVWQDVCEQHSFDGCETCLKSTDSFGRPCAYCVAPDFRCISHKKTNSGVPSANYSKCSLSSFSDLLHDQSSGLGTGGFLSDDGFPPSMGRMGTTSRRQSSSSGIHPTISPPVTMQFLSSIRSFSASSSSSSTKALPRRSGSTTTGTQVRTQQEQMASVCPRWHYPRMARDQSVLILVIVFMVFTAIAFLCAAVLCCCKASNTNPLVYMAVVGWLQHPRPRREREAIQVQFVPGDRLAKWHASGDPSNCGVQGVPLKQISLKELSEWQTKRAKWLERNRRRQEMKEKQKQI